MSSFDTPLFSFSSLEFNEGNEVEGYQIVNSIDDLPDDPKPGDVVYIKFSIFRTGSWEHPFYGDIEFDVSYLKGLIKNFESGVVPRRIGFNLEHTSHQGDIGNVGWFEKLMLRDGTVSGPGGDIDVTFLDAIVQVNSEGIKLLKDRRYAYSSAEIHPNFTTNEKFKQGNKSKVYSHGPTLVGCAFTNRPFIPSLGEVIEFSTSGGSKDSKGNNYVFSDLDGTGISYFSKLETQPVENKTNILSKSDKDEETAPIEQYNDKEESMNWEDVKGAIAEFSTEAQVEYLKDNMENFSDTAKIRAEATLEILQEVAEREAQEYSTAKRAMEEALRLKRIAEEQAAEFSQRAESLEIELAQAREGQWGDRVKLFASELRDEGHHESVVKAVVEILDGMEVDGRDKSFNFSLSGGETEELGIMGIIRKIFSALPTDARLDTTEQLQGNQEVEVNPEQGVEVAEYEVDEGTQAKLEAYSRLNNGAQCPEFLVEHLNEDGSINWETYNK